MNKLELGVEGYINPGHVVNVHFVRSPSIFNALVISREGGGENTWRLKTKEGIVYVQVFERMDLVG